MTEKGFIRLLNQSSLEGNGIHGIDKGQLGTSGFVTIPLCVCSLFFLDFVVVQQGVADISSSLLVLLMTKLKVRLFPQQSLSSKSCQAKEAGAKQ